MEYKELFDKALVEVSDRYTFSTNRETAKMIMERAEKMKKHEKIRQVKFTEITPEYTEPKKSHKALNVFAGVAGTAAVLTGAVFGLNWLNEHGGLKGPDVQGAGAGYHEDADTPAIPYYINVQQDFLARYYYDNCILFVQDYTFDGLRATVHYDVVFKDPTILSESDDSFLQYCPSVQNKRYDDEPLAILDLKYDNDIIVGVCDGYKREFPNDRPDTVSITATFSTLMPTDSITVMLLESRLNLAEEPEKFKAVMASGEYDFTLIKNVPEGYISETATVIEQTEELSYSLDHVCRVNIESDFIELVYMNVGDEDTIRLIDNPQDKSRSMRVIMKDGSSFEPSHPFDAVYPQNDDRNNVVFSYYYNFDEPIVPENVDRIYIGDVLVYGEEIGVAPNVERESFISIEFRDMKAEFEFTYYIDGELQENMTETLDMSDKQHLRWDVKGTGIHKYEIFVRNTDTDASGKLLDMDIDFSKDPPERTINDDSLATDLYREIVEQEIQQGDLSQIAGIYGPGEEPYDVVENEETIENTTVADLPEFPIAISNGNGFYGEFIDQPITGDEAWELVKERGGIDFDYNLPYDKSLFTFTGAAFVIDYADCDVKAIVGGTVEYAGWYQGWGQTILLHDENGHYWLYGHLGEVSVAEGDKVESGERIGHTGTSGLTDHQLFAMRVG